MSERHGASHSRARFRHGRTRTHRSYQVTMATLFSAAWGVALTRVIGMWDIFFGRAVSGRASTSAAMDCEAVVGPCLNLVPARMHFPDGKLDGADPPMPL
ncbi:hypothetical protein B0T25DRAFT_528406 [Lasiosphaeria hispida]|uniref:Condensation domain-containing protein n=1 Tax=Lasiosphaeria hispida TaxID=260671 RepID=A0AAJ0HVP3_9PEZI|nr:hypothetical protein B0T25DRAFT_528406 [Lasiosphaeria hispida]